MVEMRECLKLIYDRVSIRRYQPAEVPDDVILEILNAGNAAPSAGNLQARDFIVVKDPATKKKLAIAALEQMFIADAPVVIVVCANYPRSMRIYGDRGRLYAEQDATAAVENILLAAHALGLGAVWVGAFHEVAVSNILGIPEYARPIAIVPIGYPAEKPERRSRYPIQELTHWGRW
ncbi:nitroreductase family protein [Archaeoglobus veneficus]|uniref:Nitroreductase n=1 Tax=Archaeoglobus veneficus (strain DSM 11195 / SNP6) TaxID=693661 RepID=F2KQ21_ARCVS|nr:nitroreductase family protein [Archaeoglobus veneficus]AEA47624.1 nitroreductase [Archaeoglobus veneficus SNP6]